MSNDQRVCRASDRIFIQHIQQRTRKANVDNITRTNAYEQFFFQHPEIKWSFLAGLVSRNAGWNMCDLGGSVFSKLLSPSYRQRLFLTYEQANSYIFQDAYPQLLLYHYSTKYHQPLFHFCRYFSITKFMEREWVEFWKKREEKRLISSMIINEQHIIERPVINSGFYSQSIFRSWLFLLQDWLHFSTVVFPTMRGELFGASAVNFRKVDARIQLGNKLAAILFSNDYFVDFLVFAKKVVHTGSRRDYEQFLAMPPGEKTPILRKTYPVIQHQIETDQWDKQKKIKPSWYKEPTLEDICLTNWYVKKQQQLQAAAAIKQLFS
jgi:hypothetical protein